VALKLPLPGGRSNHMKRIAFTIASVGLLAVAALAPNARADEWNKKTIITVNETIQVPNKVLPPGTYVMKLLDSPSNRHIVQIFDKDEQHLETTILAIPNYRLEPTGKTQLQFWETPPGQPKALRAWFYPGDNFGQEFAYPKTEAVQIASTTHQQVPTTYAEKESELTTAKVGQVDEKGAETEMAQTTPPPPPVPTPAPETSADRVAPPPPPPAPEPAPEALPETGSPLPLIGMLGLLSLGAFFVVKVARS
jgi:hypothetical protein